MAPEAGERVGTGRRRVALLLALLAGASALGLEGCARPSADARGFNLLLVTLDTVRADHLGAYGDAAAATPALDALAAEGVRFADAQASAPLTLPSHVSLLTGLAPPHHGVHDNGGALRADVPTLATRLARAGYRTAAFVGAFVLDHRFGLARGFELYDDDIARPPGEAAALEAERPGREVVDRALAWLAKDDPRPFFLWVHLYDAHAPYRPPAPFAERFAGAPYDGEIAEVDAQVARLLAALDGRGAVARTLVAVVADHGEALGEHGEATHGLFLYQGTLRVPWLLRAPGVLPRGFVVRPPVGTVSLAPTLAGLLGLPGTSDRTPPHPAAGDGRDLSASLLRREQPETAELYAETDYPRLFRWSPLAALRRGAHKYISAPRPELYDLAADPAERRNRAAEELRLARGMAARLAQVRASAAPAAGANAGASQGPDREARRRLASLGYVSLPATAVPAPERGGADPKDRIDLFTTMETARAELGAGDLDAAAAHLEAIVAADPGNPVFRSNLADAYRRKGDLAAAAEAYERVAEETPDDPDPWYDLALVLRQMGRLDPAVAALREAIRRDPGHAEAHNALGVAEAMRGEVDDARRELERATELDPHDATAFNNLGNVLRDQGRLEDAAAAYRQAIELAPGYVDPLNGLGTVEAQRDRPAAAIADFDRVLALAPGRHEARLNRALAFELMGDRDAAIRAFRDFLTAAKDDPEFASQRLTARAILAHLGAGDPDS